jgi:hypothetical protein
MRALVLLVGCFDFAHLSSQYGQVADGGNADLSVALSDGAIDAAGAQDLAQGADLTPAPLNVGVINLAVNSATGAHNSVATVTFYDVNIPQPMTVSNCTRTTAGSCIVESCPITGYDLLPAPGPDMAGVIPPTAGTITVTGTTPTLTLNPGLDGTYTPYVNASASIFGGGENLDFQATGTGGQVGSFTQTLTAPNQVQLVAPGGAGQTISRAGDFTVTWTGGSGEMQLILSPMAMPGTTLICNVSAMAQSMVIAGALLSQLPAGMAALGVGTSQRKMFSVGAWFIGIEASINGVFSGSGANAAGNLMLQ